MQFESEKQKDKYLLPETLIGEEVTFFHEAGHATMALALGLEIHAYNIAGKVSWLAPTAPESKRNIKEAKLGHMEGVISYNSSKLKKEEDKKLLAAAGVAGELVAFDHIASPTKDQLHDRTKGGFESICDIQKVADTLADRFETGDLKETFDYVVTNMSQGLELKVQNS